MAKGRLVIDVWKDHRADPYFWVMVENVKEPYKVYYGREGWRIEPTHRETRARVFVDHDVVDADKVVGTIEIAGPTDEIIKLIEFAGYHGSWAPSRPRFLRAPRKVLVEVSRHLATLPLHQELVKNDTRNEYHFYCRSVPLERPTRYDLGLYKGRQNVITGRHIFIDKVLTKTNPQIVIGKIILGI